MNTIQRVFKPPQRRPSRSDVTYSSVRGYKRIFLAGTIDMGASVDWQEYATDKLLTDERVLILNPRRTNWDWSCEQSIHNPEFKAQVDWELDGLDESDIILMNFEKDSKSVITLLELGLHADTYGGFVISCPNGFYRKGNVEIVAERYGIPLYNNLDAAIQHVLDDL